MHIKNVLKKILVGKVRLYEVLQFINGGLKSKGRSFTTEETGLVIEGFPRCCNSFAVKAFNSAQESKVNIAHHYHHPNSIIKAVRLNKPVILLIREPAAAISSLCLREPSWKLNQALSWYIEFYQSLFPFRAKFVVADYHEVTSDFSKIIVRVNEKFHTNFALFRHTSENVERCFRQIEEDNVLQQSNHEINENKVARPSYIREKRKLKIVESLVIEHAEALQTAKALYLEFTSEN